MVSVRLNAAKGEMMATLFYVQLHSHREGAFMAYHVSAESEESARALVESRMPVSARIRKVQAVGACEPPMFVEHEWQLTDERAELYRYAPSLTDPMEEMRHIGRDE